MENKAKEKAQELVKKMENNSYCDAVGETKPYAIENAIIAVEEIISLIKTMPDLIAVHYKGFWDEVLTELKNM